MIADYMEINGLISSILGIIILLATGLFVSFFIGSEIIISGIKAEKRIDEKTEEEIRKETISLEYIQKELENIKKQINKLNAKK